MAFLAQRYVSGKSRPGWSERWGHLSLALHANTNSRSRIWVHAVSAGEVVAAVPILRELRELLPTHDVLFSVVTPAGHEMAEQQARPYINGLFYFPFDLPWVVRSVVNALKPQVFVSLESEMWPNLLHELKRQGCHTVMVNGRISEQSYRRSRKWARSLFRWMLGNMDRLLVQSPSDAQRIRELGNLTESGRVVVVGNSKFDQEIARLTPEQCCELRTELNLPATAPVFVAGSTRSEEEDAQVIAAYQTMRAQFPDLCLIIAPRQIDRAGELATAMQAAGLSPFQRSEMKAEKTGVQETGEGGQGTGDSEKLSTPKVQHLILDTMGELANVYAVATLAFVGNSFAPVVKGGGQNLLQPLAHGKPVLFGPHIATIRAEAMLAIESGVGFKVADGAELAQRGLMLLRDEALQAEIAERALKLIAANRGVSRRYAEMVAEMAH